MKMTALCLLNTMLMATGQMLFKTGSAGRENSSMIDIIKLFFTPIVFFALCLYAATTGLWLFILSRTPMSHAYPIQALAYPLVLGASAIFFNEQITPLKWLGIVIIVCGVFVATHG